MKTIILIAVLAIACQQTYAKLGGFKDVDPNSVNVRVTLEKVLLTQNSRDVITKVLSVKEQIRSGTFYVVEFETVNEQNIKRICKAEYLNQPWVSKVPQVQSFICKAL